MKNIDEIYITRKFHISKKIIFAILVIIISIIWFFVGYEVGIHQINQTFVHSHVRHFLMRKPATVADVQSIQSWMTFDYINTIFHIPPTILKQSLSITDTTYPRITIKKYASLHNLNQATVISNIKSIITSYLNTGITSGTTTNSTSTI